MTDLRWELHGFSETSPSPSKKNYVNMRRLGEVFRSEEDCVPPYISTHLEEDSVRKLFSVFAVAMAAGVFGSQAFAQCGCESAPGCGGCTATVGSSVSVGGCGGEVVDRTISVPISPTRA